MFTACVILCFHVKVVCAVGIRIKFKNQSIVLIKQSWTKCMSDQNKHSIIYINIYIIIPKTMKYWVGVQRGQSYMGRRCLFSLGWQPF